ncbi:MAG: sigma-70 family RNA polymerase sigma factor [Bacteriovoracia bacterium]
MSLPWAEEIATDPRKIQELIENKALEDWYSEHSGESKVRKVDDSTFSFLSNEKRRIRKFISKLSDVEQVIVYLRYWENLMTIEIASVVGLSENKIHDLLERAIKKLRIFYIQELSRVQATALACV